MMKKYWVKSALLVSGVLVGGLASFGGGCLSTMVQRILVSTAFD